MCVVDYINAHCYPKYSDLEFYVSNSEDNIRFAAPGMVSLLGDLLMKRGFSNLSSTKFVQKSLIIGATRVILFSIMKLPLFTPS